MPRKKKAQLPVVDINRSGAVDRARKLAGFCRENSTAMLRAQEVLDYLDTSGKGENPADVITVDKDIATESR